MRRIPAHRLLLATFLEPTTPLHFSKSKCVAFDLSKIEIYDTLPLKTDV